ncbi:MAG: PAS domain-containing protein [Anaerovibrio sp.]|uniref:PAS domain-containing protein n=1 Tax=Anaerovibrio sp. TaxID=1872532 RepID=UPI0025E694A7|nr:PAS domain-containing protein [Anaerovibrio sp.]MCR5175738.1 PAS domain-containing protein [Anaerovibrio sp.]
MTDKTYTGKAGYKQRDDNRQRVQEALQKQEQYPKRDYSNKLEKAQALEAVLGHPLHTFSQENAELNTILARAKSCNRDQGSLKGSISELRQVAVHYAKKGDLLYPLLKVKYGVTGPSDVMWTHDDEIRDELAFLERAQQIDNDWTDRFENVLKRIGDMKYKEQNILFPICAVNFTKEEWYGIYHDSKDYQECFGVENLFWQEAVERGADVPETKDNEVVMPGGHMTVDQITALLNTVPMEISFVDADNINRFFNEGPKVFKRPSMAIDRDVFSCHPPKIEPMVRKIIEDFREGRRDSVPVWMEKNGKTMLVTYMAVRNNDGQYIGTAEFVQDMEFAKAHFAGKRR